MASPRSACAAATASQVRLRCGPLHFAWLARTAACAVGEQHACLAPHRSLLCMPFMPFMPLCQHFTQVPPRLPARTNPSPPCLLHCRRRPGLPHGAVHAAAPRPLRLQGAVASRPGPPLRPLLPRIPQAAALHRAARPRCAERAERAGPPVGAQPGRLHRHLRPGAACAEVRAVHDGLRMGCTEAFSGLSTVCSMPLHFLHLLLLPTQAPHPASVVQHADGPAPAVPGRLPICGAAGCRPGGSGPRAALPHSAQPAGVWVLTVVSR